MQFALTANCIHRKQHSLQVRRQYSRDLGRKFIQSNFNSVQHVIQCVLHPVHLWLTATFGPSWVSENVHSMWPELNATWNQSNQGYSTIWDLCNHIGIQWNLNSVQDTTMDAATIDSIHYRFNASMEATQFEFSATWIQMQHAFKCNMDFPVCSV